MRPRTRRLTIVLFAAILILVAVGLTIFALQLNANLFYTPSSLKERGGPVIGKTIKLGGLVEIGSLEFGDNAEMIFVITDEGTEKVTVHFRGIAPDLFREGSGVVSTGAFNNELVFVADSLLAKHDENYVPRELQSSDYMKRDYD